MKLIKTLLIATMILGTQAVYAADKAMVQTNTTTSQMQPLDKLNINLATATEIQKSLIGIGAKKAEAIVQYREKYGNFSAVEQLLEVQGIGKAILDKNRDRIIF